MYKVRTVYRAKCSTVAFVNDTAKIFQVLYYTVIILKCWMWPAPEAIFCVKKIPVFERVSYPFLCVYVIHCKVWCIPWIISPMKLLVTHSICGNSQCAACIWCASVCSSVFFVLAVTNEGTWMLKGHLLFSISHSHLLWSNSLVVSTTIWAQMLF